MNRDFVMACFGYFGFIGILFVVLRVLNRAERSSDFLDQMNCSHANQYF